LGGLTKISKCSCIELDLAIYISLITVDFLSFQAIVAVPAALFLVKIALRK